MPMTASPGVAPSSYPWRRRHVVGGVVMTALTVGCGGLSGGATDGGTDGRTDSRSEGATDAARETGSSAHAQWVDFCKILTACGLYDYYPQNLMTRCASEPNPAVFAGDSFPGRAGLRLGRRK